MKIIVKLFGKPLMIAELDSNLTIKDLKQSIMSAKKIDIEQQRIVYLREPLDVDSMTLDECNLKDGSIVYLMLRLFVKKESAPKSSDRVKKIQTIERLSNSNLKHSLNK